MLDEFKNNGLYVAEKDSNGECIMDLAETMSLKWDSLCYYSLAYDYKTILDEVGNYRTDYHDIGTRLFFMHKGRVVYAAELFPYPSECHLGGFVFMFDEDIIVLYPHDAKFRVFKHLRGDDYDDGKFLYMEKIE